MEARDRSVSRVLEALTAPFSGDGPDAVEFLDGFVERCRRVLGVAACGVLVADDPDRRLRLAATSSPAEVWSGLPYVRGPAGDCVRTGEAFFDVDLVSAGGRWSDFARAATGAGVRWTTVLPVRSGGRAIGVLSLLSDRARTDPVQAVSSRAAADLIAIGLTAEASGGVIPPRVRWDEAMDGWILLERAAGVLAVRAGVDPDAAREQLRTHAHATGTPLSSLAGAVLRGTVRPDGTGWLVVPPAADRDAPLVVTGDLTDAEVELLARVSRGSSALTVSGELGIDLHELGRRLTRVRARLGVSSTAAAVHLVRQQGRF